MFISLFVFRENEDTLITKIENISLDIKELSVKPICFFLGQRFGHTTHNDENDKCDEERDELC